MKENFVSLAKLLATDDEFQLGFSSKTTEEEKYKLAKTKLPDLSQKDFSEFLVKLHEAEKASMSKISLDKMQMVSGGGPGLTTKLAATSLFVTAMGATGIMSQQADAAPNDFATLDLENTFAIYRQTDADAVKKKADDVRAVRLFLTQNFTERHLSLDDVGAIKMGLTSMQGNDLAMFALTILNHCPALDRRQPTFDESNVTRALNAWLTCIELCCRSIETNKSFPAIPVPNYTSSTVSTAIADNGRSFFSNVMLFIDPGRRKRYSGKAVCNFATTNGKSFFLDKYCAMHSFVATTDGTGKITYGHSKFAKEFAELVAQQRLSWIASLDDADKVIIQNLYTLLVGVTPDVPMISLTSDDEQFEGLTHCFFGPESTKPNEPKTIFPDDWTFEHYRTAIIKCLECGTRYPSRKGYICCEYTPDSTDKFNFKIRVIFKPADGNRIISFYPRGFYYKIT